MNLDEIKSAVEGLECYFKSLPEDNELSKKLFILKDLATSVLNAEMPKEKQGITYHGGRTIKYSPTDNQKIGYNQALHDCTLAHTRILLEKEEIIKQLQPEYFKHINRIGDTRKCGHFVQDILSYCPICRELSELKQELAKLKAENEKAIKLLNTALCYISDDCIVSEAHFKKYDAFEEEAKSFLEGR